MTLSHLVLASSGSVSFFKGWKLTGNFTAVDLVAASANALSGALLARRPDHYKNFTVPGILAMALLGGLTGGITRDLMLGQIPAALTNPAYLTLCLGFGIVGYSIAYAQGQLFREGVFQFMTSFSLVWFAIVGAQAAVHKGLPVLGSILLAVISPTAGRWLIDVSCGVTPKQFIRGEWFLAVAALTGVVWILAFAASNNTWIAAAVAFVVGFLARSAALWYGWEEPLASEPAGVYEHSDQTVDHCSAASSKVSPSASFVTLGCSSRTRAMDRRDVGRTAPSPVSFSDGWARRLRSMLSSDRPPRRPRSCRPR